MAVALFSIKVIDSYIVTRVDIKGVVEWVISAVLEPSVEPFRRGMRQVGWLDEFAARKKIPIPQRMSEFAW